MASITYTTPNIRLLDQRQEQSNPNDDCVFESDAMAVNALVVGANMNATKIKAMDNDYGPQYVGFASQAALVDTLAKLGVTMVRVAHPTQQQLIDELHWQIEHYHHPCIVTMPSQWNSAPTVKGYSPRAYRGYSHVGLMCGSGPGMLRCANPWGGFFQDQTDAWWAQRLLMGEIWVASKTPVAPGPVAASPKPSPIVAANPVTAPVATVEELQAKISAAVKALQ